MLSAHGNALKSPLGRAGRRGHEGLRGSDNTESFLVGQGERLPFPKEWVALPASDSVPHIRRLEPRGTPKAPGGCGATLS